MRTFLIMRKVLHPLLPLVAVLVVAGATACSGSSDTAEAPARSAPGDATSLLPAQPPCPTTPVKVVVSVEQWADVVRARAGACAVVTALVTGSAGDPHDYEPSPSDNAAIAGAELVVVNGAGYDEWATKAVDAASPRPAVLDVGEVTATPEGANPHLWYSPEAVDLVGAAATDQLKTARPDAAAYFDDRVADADAAFAPYRAAVERATGALGGTAFAATESVFAPMADHLGMVDATPEGFARATANESEPSPGDLAAFEDALRNRKVAVLIVNSQASSSVRDQLRGIADDSDVPVVEVTETPAPGSGSFVDWQVAQLDALVKAVG